MGQQEDFRTPGDARGQSSAPLFDEQSALKAAPVVPLETVARRERFAHLAGGWRETVRTPLFRRSWPLALLLVATLVAAAAAINVRRSDGAAQAVDTTAGAANNETAADAERAAASPSRNEIGNARDARRGRESNVSPDDAPLNNPEAFAASALGSFIGGDANASNEQGDAAVSGRDERGGGRDRSGRHKRSKRRHGSRHNGGGAVLFDVIR